MLKEYKNKEFNIEEELKNTPTRPGVYLLKDKTGNVIYVGKAVNLKNRVKSYFQKGSKSPRIEKMVSKVKHFEYIVANDEREAFIMECDLIKSHRPRYNIMMKDDKSYPYIKITMADKYPRIEITRRYKNDGSRYFGPFPERISARKAVSILQTAFPIRTCKKTKMGGDARPCLNHQIKRCLGPCAGLCTQEEYTNQVEALIRFLEGKTPDILEEIKRKMEEASHLRQYEKAAVYRDRIDVLRKVSDIYMVDPGMKRSDVVACACEKGLVSVFIFNIRDGAVSDSKQFEFDDVIDRGEHGIMIEFLRQYYGNIGSVPREILVQNEIGETQWLAEWLEKIAGFKVDIKTPKRGDKKKLADTAYDNAKIGLETFKQKRNADKGNLIQLAKLLELEVLPERIEAYDISNLAGKDTVGSMVVFVGGKPVNRLYRKFSIRQDVDGDDLLAMSEMIQRRFAKAGDDEFGEMPDLVMIDGGKNQVNVVKAEIETAGFSLPVCGMVKDDKHTTRGIIYENIEHDLKKNMPLFRFVSAVQNEAHRFAIEYNRKKRQSRYFDSELDRIPGIGAKRKDALMKHFGSIREIKAVSREQLESVKGISKMTADNIFEYFHGKE